MRRNKDDQASKESKNKRKAWANQDQETKEQANHYQDQAKQTNNNTHENE
jgi:hypothetical protein